jgi:hypothetical protein
VDPIVSGHKESPRPPFRELKNASCTLQTSSDEDGVSTIYVPRSFTTLNDNDGSYQGLYHHPRDRANNPLFINCRARGRARGEERGVPSVREAWKEDLLTKSIYGVDSG